MTTEVSSDDALPFLRSSKDFDILCECWERAWHDLTSDRPFRGTKETKRSFALRMWALIDQPQTYRCSINYESAQKCFIENIKQTPYPDSPLSSGEFRLLQSEPRARGAPIRVNLSKFPIASSMQRYSAVSYWWGPPNQDQMIVFVNGRPVAVNKIFFRLLGRLNRWARGFYWIDALCINQSRVEEKNMQIPLMGRIYREAEFVDAWLDGLDVYSILHLISGDNIWGWKTNLPFLKGANQMLQEPWFKRIWVVQEVALAKPHALVLHQGFSECNWDKFSKFFQLDRRLEKSTPLSSPIGHALMRLQYNVALSGVTNLILQRGDFWSEGHPEPKSPWQLWFENLGMEATDPRDKVYGVLGMASPDCAENSTVDYRKSIPEVYLEATISLMTSNPYMFVRMIYGAPVLSTKNEFGEDSPSWALDFSYAGRGWATTFCERTWQDAWKGKVPSDLSSQFRIVDRDLIVGASAVDEIEHIIRCPSAEIAFEALADMPDLSELQKITERTITERVRFLSEAQKLYERSSVASRVWDRGESWALWQLVLLGLETAASASLAATVREEECAEKFAALIKEDADPMSAHGGSEPLSQMLGGNLMSFDQLLFFVTRHGLGGFCMDGAQIGDRVSMLFRDISGLPDIPFVIRPREDGSYSMMTVAWLPKNWQDLSKFRQTLDPETIVIR